jgi:signal transduction histidine kinase
LRDDFISIASHELRTPVTSLKLYVQALQKQVARSGEEQMVRSFARMDAQLNKLTMLIRDLLDVSRIELGRLDFQEEPFDLNEVAREAVEQIQPTSNKHGFRIEGEIERPVRGDKDRIGQVLTNLLTNAIKYSPYADTIIVRLSEGQDEAAVSVQDFGIGIEQAHLPIFSTAFIALPIQAIKVIPVWASGCTFRTRLSSGTAARCGSRARRGAALCSRLACRIMPLHCLPVTQMYRGRGDER